MFTPMHSSNSSPDAEGRFGPTKNDLSGAVYARDNIAAEVSEAEREVRVRQEALQRVEIGPVVAALVVLAVFTVFVIDLVIFSDLVSFFVGEGRFPAHVEGALRYLLAIGVLGFHAHVGRLMIVLSGRLRSSIGTYAGASDRRWLRFWRVLAVVFSFGMSVLSFVMNWTLLEAIGAALGISSASSAATPFFAALLTLFGHLALFFGFGHVVEAEAALSARWLAWRARRRENALKRRLAAAENAAWAAFFLLEEAAERIGGLQHIGSLPRHVVLWLERSELLLPAPGGDTLPEEHAPLDALSPSDAAVEADDGGEPEVDDARPHPNR